MSLTAQLRTAFLDFFAGHEHHVVPSAPLVPLNDPSLLFTNAGMVPFKNYFTGTDTPPQTRLTSAQKCLRAGGKHNDLDNVGYTARHHTFFEMLGNFSLGEYFKEQAIFYAWEFVRKTLELPTKRLLVTVHDSDDEAHALWRKIAGLKDAQLLRIASDDNFWSMGETGPCGPCSEIFYDHGPKLAGGPPGSRHEDGARFVEIWNLVFMQYETLGGGKRVDLPKPSIDTGMGLERISAIAHGSHDNYDTDLFRNLIAASAAHSGQDAQGAHNASHRVIADHIRAACFLIADGVLPANDGRGYVLRRILRRAMRHAHLLGARTPYLWRLVAVVQKDMGAAYPELGRAEALITETLRQEETRFGDMLVRGLKLLAEETDKLGSKKQLSGAAAFRLYDTYGFPLDLTQDALKAKGIGVDEKGFAHAMAEQKTRARAAWVGSGATATQQIWFDLHARLGATEFLGYRADAADALVQAIVVDDTEVATLKSGQRGAVLLNQTPFYAEGGGQLGDIGDLQIGESRFVVDDTQRQADGLVVHIGKQISGTLKAGDGVHARIDAERRAMLRAHHSATHLLHKALRQVLGAHVTQKGSLVAPDRLRFDFSHPKAVSKAELANIEQLINAQIRTNDTVRTQLMARAAAQKAGAIALFGEKYDDEVRVLSMGQDVLGAPWSIELCGGTHVRALGEILMVKLIGESAVAAGVRRIEAVAGGAALAHFAQQEQVLRALAQSLKTTPAALPERVAALVAERKTLAEALAQAQKSLAMGGGKQAATPPVHKIGDVQLMAACLDGIAPRDLRSLVDEGKKKLGSGVVALVGIANGKAGLAIGVSEDLTKRFDAVALAKLGATKLGGTGGGGRRDMAQAGGPNVNAAQAALEAVRAALAG